MLPRPAPFLRIIGGTYPVIRNMGRNHLDKTQILSFGGKMTAQEDHMINTLLRETVFSMLLCMCIRKMASVPPSFMCIPGLKSWLIQAVLLHMDRRGLDGIDGNQHPPAACRTHPVEGSSVLFPFFMLYISEVLPTAMFYFLCYIYLYFGKPLIFFFSLFLR